MEIWNEMGVSPTHQVVLSAAGHAERAPSGSAHAPGLPPGLVWPAQLLGRAFPAAGASFAAPLISSAMAAKARHTRRGKGYSNAAPPLRAAARSTSPPPAAWLAGALCGCRQVGPARRRAVYTAGRASGPPKARLGALSALNARL